MLWGTPPDDQDTGESDTVSAPAADESNALCPSAGEAVNVVALWSGPLVTMDKSKDPATFTVPFTNALDEVATFVQEDSEVAPCAGQLELLDTAQMWSDVAVMVADANRFPTDGKLQPIAEAGNLWLAAIDDTTLEFTTDTESSEMLN